MTQTFTVNNRTYKTDAELLEVLNSVKQSAEIFGAVMAIEIKLGRIVEVNATATKMEIIANSYAMGVDAATKGMHGAPVMNPEFMATIEGGNHKFATAAMKAYTKGWTVTNLLMPVEA